MQMNSGDFDSRMEEVYSRAVALAKEGVDTIIQAEALQVAVQVLEIERKRESEGGVRRERADILVLIQEFKAAATADGAPRIGKWQVAALNLVEAAVKARSRGDQVDITFDRESQSDV